jgi:hypothetical protein
MKEKKDVVQDLIKLREQSKFNEDISIFYPGLENTELKGLLTGLVNKIIDNFISLINQCAAHKEYQSTIAESLSEFDALELDTEERERLCQYLEQIMEVIGIESSRGIINKWLYGFEI